MAERVGFEPTVPLPGRMLSKHVDSSTLAPLRIEKYKEDILACVWMTSKAIVVHRCALCVHLEIPLRGVLTRNGGTRFPRSYGLTLTWVQRYNAIQHCPIVWSGISRVAPRAFSTMREWRNWQTRET